LQHHSRHCHNANHSHDCHNAKFSVFR
jgi:hypothetical protein